MPAEQRALTSGVLSKMARLKVIGDEPGNTDNDPGPSEKAIRKAKERHPSRRYRLRPVPFLSVCLAVKPVGEPDAGDRHVRFDERGWETGRCRTAQATAPILDSTDSDLPARPLNVRYWGYFGRQVLAASISHFDPGCVKTLCVK
jgi:hypothetical protein